MTDWLNEIEADFEDENYPTKVDGQRMARVLREFVRVANKAKEVTSWAAPSGGGHPYLEVDPQDVGELDGLLDALSDDAKELLK